MTDTEFVLGALRGLTADDHLTRAATAGSIGDLMHELADDTPILATALVMARLCEPDRTAQEAELHVLADMAEYGMVSSRLRLLILAGIDAGDDPSQLEYMGDIENGESRNEGD